MIPTAEEFLTKIVVDNNNSFDIKESSDITNDVTEAMIEFAKLHVEAALKAASEKAKTKNKWDGNTGSEFCDTVVDSESILNAYDLNQIK